MNRYLTTMVLVLAYICNSATPAHSSPYEDAYSRTADIKALAILAETIADCSTTDERIVNGLKIVTDICRLLHSAIGLQHEYTYDGPIYKGIMLNQADSLAASSFASNFYLLILHTLALHNALKTNTQPAQELTLQASKLTNTLPLLEIPISEDPNLNPKTTPIEKKSGKTKLYKASKILLALTEICASYALAMTSHSANTFYIEAPSFIDPFCDVLPNLVPCLEVTRAINTLSQRCNQIISTNSDETFQKTILLYILLGFDCLTSCKALNNFNSLADEALLSYITQNFKGHDPAIIFNQFFREINFPIFIFEPLSILEKAKIAKAALLAMNKQWDLKKGLPTNLNGNHTSGAQSSYSKPNFTAMDTGSAENSSTPGVRKEIIRLQKKKRSGSAFTKEETKFWQTHVDKRKEPDSSRK